MSAKVTALLWEHYDPGRFGAPLVMALALGDEADDRGGGISQSVPRLAKKTRQTERAVRKQLRKMQDSGLASCAARSAGGVGKFSEYSLNLGLLFAPENPERGSGLTLNVVQGSEAQNPVPGSGFVEPPLSKYLGTTSTKDVIDASKDRVSEQQEFRRMAEWMFGRLVKLNPKLRTPGWPGWCRDIRFMVERDGHTLREIGELFAFANEHTFWQTNIESPGKLRKQWNRLQLERGKAGGGGEAPKAVDTTCQGKKPDGSRCGSVNTTGDSPSGDGPYFCWDCRTAMERARAGARPAAHAGR